MSAHTPGPWYVNETSSADGTKVSIEASYYRFVAQVDGGASQEANARLIAAAPELLSALQEVFVIGDRLVSDVYGHEFVESARAAIAKATGVAP